MGYFHSKTKTIVVNIVGIKEQIDRPTGTDRPADRWTRWNTNILPPPRPPTPIPHFDASNFDNSQNLLYGLCLAPPPNMKNSTIGK